MAEPRSRVPQTMMMFVITCLAAVTAGTTGAEQEFERIAVIGASASAGFGVVERITDSDGNESVEGVGIGDLLLAAGDDLVVLDLSSGGFFMRPLALGGSCVERVEAWSPDLVIAIDFLFWFVYGPGGGADSEAAGTPDPRLLRLEEGLELLSKLETPIVVGEIPDMSGAIGGMLRRAQVPEKATMLAANRRIREWAESRPRTAVVPLFELNERLASGEAFTVGGTTWDPATEAFELILPDRLHPTLEGLVALLQSAVFEADRIPGMGEHMPELETDRLTLTNRIRRPRGPAEREPAATSAGP